MSPRFTLGDSAAPTSRRKRTDKRQEPVTIAVTIGERTVSGRFTVSLDDLNSPGTAYDIRRITGALIANTARRMLLDDTLSQHYDHDTPLRDTSVSGDVRPPAGPSGVSRS